MKRNNFLAEPGISSAAVILSTYLGCSKNSGRRIAPSNFPSNADFTPDLTSFTNASLLINASVATGPANLSLVAYKTQFTGSYLRIYA